MGTSFLPPFLILMSSSSKSPEPVEPRLCPGQGLLGKHWLQGRHVASVSDLFQEDSQAPSGEVDRPGGKNCQGGCGLAQTGVHSIQGILLSSDLSLPCHRVRGWGLHCPRQCAVSRDQG